MAAGWRSPATAIETFIYLLRSRVIRFHSKSLSTEVHILGSHFSVCQPITARSRQYSVTESVVLPPDPSAEHHRPAGLTPNPRSLFPIEWPRCPKFQGRMMLARIQPGPKGSVCGRSNVRSSNVSKKRWSRSQRTRADGRRA
jgi:hypothetical protein